MKRKVKKLRSSLEDRVVASILEHGAEFEYESFKLVYTKAPSVYTPDLILPNGIIIEVKGYFDADDRSKHLLIKEQYPMLDLRFVFQLSSKKINKASTTTYADWCDKHGFKYHDGTIPQSWFKERGSTAGRELYKDIKSSGRKTARKYTSGCFTSFKEGI